MIKEAPTGTWEKFLKLLPSKSQLGDAALPENLTYCGEVDLGCWNPPDAILFLLRTWMKNNGYYSVFYFLLEGVQDEPFQFEIRNEELSEENLEDINPGYRCAIVSQDMSWAISSDENKVFHISGNCEIRDVMIGKATDD